MNAIASLKMASTNPLMTQAVEPLRDFLLSLGTIGMLVWIVLKILAIAVPVIVSVAFYVVWERKLIGWMHVRHGPMYVGWGVLQAFADVFKLLFKEVLQPSVAHPFLFRLAPLIALVPAFAAWAVVPFDAQVVLSNANAGLLYLLAMTSLGVYGVILAGWASNSTYAFLGAMRGAAQVVSYEIAMGFALVGVLIAAGSLNLSDIVNAQGGNGGFTEWFMWPLLPLFLVYFISGVAETNRAPFDVAEGESEIVAGFHVEYSGSAFAIFFLAEYANMILVSFLASLLFLGGWLSPFPASWGLLGVHGWWWLFAKALFFAFSFVWFRASFPRYRYDQIMRLGWKVFIPITIAWIFVMAQSGNAGFLEWFWVPLLPLFVVYFISGVAETNRAPFDVVEGESEIVAGHMVEYSGSQFALFFLAEYANMILISFLTSIFFLGGWLSPFQGMGIPLLSVDGWWWLLAKVFFFASCFIWFRASFPRYRYDQIMRLGWKVFIPITIAWIFVTALMVYFGLIQAGQ